ncbi:MAG: hypothetical protein ACR2KQ_05575 [Actinomycetota bacterium]|jgi:hypothetical protein
MGLKDAIKQGIEAQRTNQEQSGESQHYDAEVNKGSISVRHLNATLNRRYEAGYKLAHILEQAGNTILIWERYR